MTLKEITKIVSANVPESPENISYGRTGKRINNPAQYKRPAIERFCSKIVINPEKGCWEWQGSKFNNGYGSFASDNRKGKRKTTTPHRFIMSYLEGEILSHLEVDHLCHNRICANPEHLRIVTHQENSACRRKSDYCRRGHLRTNGICQPCKKIARIKYNLKNQIKTKKFRRYGYFLLNCKPDGKYNLQYHPNLKKRQISQTQ